MQKPVSTVEITLDEIADAQSQGLPVIGGKQAIASARLSKPGQPAVNWYHLEDGTEAIQDDQGNAVGWPS